MTLRIELTLAPTAEQRQAILEPLRAYNIAKAGDGQYQEIALLVRDEHSNEVLGGLFARMFYHWLFIDLLSVPEQARGQGIGSQLMQQIEEQARAHQCLGMYLDTFDFQAPDFYRRHGFIEVGQIADYPPGGKRFFFQKRLDG